MRLNSHTCVHRQGNHCVKIGLKCVERRIFEYGNCLIKENVQFVYSPKYDEITKKNSTPPGDD